MTSNKEELKKMFFAQYYGQKVLRWHQWLETTENSYINFSIPAIEKEGWILHLKSIDNITDEDAEKLSVTLVNVVGLDGLIKQQSKALVLEVVNNYSQIDCLFMLPSSFTDLVRQLGYCIDWNNIKIKELIKLGWVKLIKQT